MAESMRRSWLHGRILLPVVLLLVNTGYLLGALTITSPYQDEGVGPAFFPILISIMMYAALAVALVQGVRAGPPPEAVPLRLGPPLKVVLLTGAYILLFNPLGYFVSTTAYAYGLFYVFDFGRRSQILRIVTAVAIALIGYALFGLAFGVRLPKLLDVL